MDWLMYTIYNRNRKKLKIDFKTTLIKQSEKQMNITMETSKDIHAKMRIMLSTSTLYIHL